MLLGPAIGRALGPQDLAELRPLLEIAAGVVLFQLGQRVDPAWLGRNPWILATSIVEAAAAFGAVFCVLLALDARPLTAALAAAVGMATAPAVALTVARETRAQGQVAERMLLLTALNCIYAFVTVNVLLGWAASDHSADWRASALHPLYVIFGSAALAGGFALSTLALLRLLDRRRLFVSLTFGRIGTILLMLLFALTAAAIDLALVPAGLAAGAAVAAARFAGKALGVFAFARPSGLPLRKAWLLALSLTPMSAIALVLVHETAGRVPALDTSLAAVLIGSVLILEVAGPLLAKFALVRAGETDERLD